VIRRTSGRSVEYYIQQSFEETVDQLVRDRGDESTAWQWGNIHRVRYSTPIAEMLNIGKWQAASRWGRGDAPMPGEANTVSVSVPDGKRLRALIGASSRFICDLARPNEAWFAHSPGLMAGPNSPFDTEFARKSQKMEYFRSALWNADKVPDVVERVILLP